MNLKPKTVRRLTLLAVVAFLVFGSGFALIVVRQWQKSRTTTRFGQEAIAFHEKGQHYQSMVSAANYLKRASPRDTKYLEVLKIYADERLKVEEPDFSHLRQAISFYRQYLERKPDDVATKRVLLDLFAQAGLHGEARELAHDLLPADVAAATVADAPVLHAEAAALYAMRTGPERAKQILDRLAQLQPLNIANEGLHLQWLAQTGAPADARAYADRLLASNPGDPRAELLVVMSRMIDPKQSEAQDQWQRVCRIAGLDPKDGSRVQPANFPDVAFAQALINIFDRVNAFDQGLQVLKDAAATFDDPLLKRLLVRRLWQEGRFAEVEDICAKLDPASSSLAAELFGFRGLSLMALSRIKEGDAVAVALSAREGDYHATTWSKALPLASPDSKVAGVEKVEALRSIVKSNPNEPVFLLMLGDALAAVGRTDDARKYWEDAEKFPIVSSWPAPWVRVAESSAVDGRVEPAAAAALQAIRMAPRKVSINVLWLETQAALIQRGASGAESPRNLLERIDQIEVGLSQANESEYVAATRNRLVPTRVLLLSRMGEKDKACDAVRRALADDSGVQEDTLRRLVSVCETEHLGLEAECVAKAEAKFGQTSGVALSRALELAGEGNPDEGLANLRAAVKSHPGDLSYQIALARFLERVGNPEALQTWIQLGDQNPGNLAAQRACLMSNATVADRAFIERTIQRYTGLMGSDAGEDYYARVARAQSVIYGSPSRRDRDEAVAILGGLVAAQPSMVEPKMLLAGALALSDPSRDISPDLPRAISQLSDAAAREPRSPRVAIELARIYQTQRDWDHAREQLVRVASDSSFDADSRTEAARMLLAQGEPGPAAVSTLTDVTQQLGDRASPAVLLLLAQAHVMLREDDQAAPLYDRLAQASRDPESLLMAANFYARRGDPAKAASTLARLDAMQLSPGIKELTVARYLAEQGKPEEAKAQFEKTVAVAPTRAESWRHYISFCLARGDSQTATSVAERAIKAVPGDPSLIAMRERVRGVATDIGQSEVKSLIDALSRDPASAEAAQSLRLLQQASDRGELSSSDDLVKLADRYPTNTPIQMYVARRIVATDPGRAAVVVNRAMAASPADPAPARLASEIYLRTERWSDMLDAANAWRQRDPSRSAEADVAVAEAYCNLKDYGKGLDVLAPRIQAALASPTDPYSLAILNMQTRLLIGAGHESDARQFLGSLLSSSREVRLAIWLPAIAREQLSSQTTTVWLDQVRPALAANTEEQFALAMVFDALSMRLPAESERYIGEAKSLLSRLAEKPETTTGTVVEALGVIRHRTGDIKGAEEAYRRAIGLDSKRVIALNNLASISLEARRNDEALDLAKRAVEASQSGDPASLDTLGQAYDAIAETKGSDPSAADDRKKAAAAYLLCAKLTPTVLAPLAKASTSLQHAGDTAGAVQCYEMMLKIPGLTDQGAALIKSNLAQSIVHLKRTDQYERARTLAGDAVRAQPLPSTCDTQGWVELAMGRPEEAIQAFRRGLELSGSAGQPPLPSSTVGLGVALSTGTPDQRQEASKLLGSVRADSLEPDVREAATHATEALAAPAAPSGSH
jgi:tetratricopeptide (TPR) repeat protein